MILLSLDKELQKQADWNARRKQLYKQNKRAEVAGISPLPPKGQRLEWEMSIIRAEKEQSNSNADSG